MEDDPFFDNEGLEYLFGIVTAEDGEPRFTAIWGRDRAEEKAALEEFIDLVGERRRRFPDLHVYHYASYEVTALKRLAGAHGTREEELDQLLRDEVFVDLYKVVGESMLISQPSYSIKKVEAFYMEQRDTAVSDGGDSIVMFEQWLEKGEKAVLDEIAAYNRDDCVSTLKLRDWLLERRAEAERQFEGTEEARRLTWFEPQPQERGEESLALREDNEALMRALLDGLPAEVSGWGPDERARRLVVQLLEYHHREARPVWWAFFDRVEAEPADLKEDAEAIAMITADEAPPREEKRSLVHRLSFPPQETKLGRGAKVFGAPDGERAGEIVAIDHAAGRLELKRGPSLAERPIPAALIPGGPYGTGEQQAALRRLAATLLGDGEGPAAHAAARQILRREPPRLHDREPGEPIDHDGMELEELKEIVALLEESHLFVQGPPGSGKTWTGARLIVDLIGRGRRVGVTSTSHKVIHNLLGEVEEVAARQGVEFRGLKKSSSGNPESEFDSVHGLIESVGDNGALSDPEVALSAGTAWHYCREDTAPLDYLFIDEAGQVSLADALALATAARNVVLLGDPQQLPQVSQGAHPEGSSLSVLEHLLGDDQTVDVAHGIFLGKTLAPAPADRHLRLGADVRRAAGFGAGAGAPADRGRGRAEWRRPALAAGRARGPLPVLARGGGRDRGRDRAPARRRHLHRRRRRRPPAAPRGHPRPDPLQRPGPLPPGPPPRRHPSRHRRQVPGPGGPGRLLLHGHLQRRADPPQRRVPLLPQPPKRRHLPGAVSRSARLQPAPARHPREVG